MHGVRRRMCMSDRAAGLSLAQGVEHKGVGQVVPPTLSRGAQSPTAILRRVCWCCAAAFSLSVFRCEIGSCIVGFVPALPQGLSRSLKSWHVAAGLTASSKGDNELPPGQFTNCDYSGTRPESRREFPAQPTIEARLVDPG